MATNGGNRLVGKRIADRYCITGEIGKGGMGVVYKAIPFDDPSHAVAIKVIQRSGRLGYDDLMRFQKEASLMSQLHHPNIVVFHELGLFGREQDEGIELGSGYYIVMEIADGTNLKESLARDGRKDLAYFFQVGLQVSTALDYTHGKNIIHRDIKPHNIIVGQAWRDQRGVLVKVLDFGVARLAEALHYAGHKDGHAKGFDEAAGTPLYMAPEQTQLMDAPIDHRVDLYSLGCVLYELLAGKPPFSANSRDKLEKLHVFAELEPLTNLRPDIPPLVERIVHKLLAKHPKDRYQTAFALHADLMRAKAMFEKNSRGPTLSFPLGLKDRFHAVSAQLKLVGREKELQALIAGYDGVVASRGRSRLSLVKGGAGIGKTRLIAEFQSYLARRKVRFISGSFSQHENALPFNALANAFNEYLHRILKSHPHEAEELRRRIKTTIGPMAHRVADVVPGLKPFILDVPEEEILEKDPEALDFVANPETFSTFAKAFSDFTRCLSTDNQPVVFLFHDLHWADAKSLDLIDQFFSNANTLPFYLVVSQRTGLHLTHERFNQFIDKFRKLKRRFQEIDLEPVSQQAVRDIVGHMLSSPESVGADLVAYLEHESRGNPMHLVELTRTLVARDLIFPNPMVALNAPDAGLKQEWSYDIKALRQTDIQLNTIDLILSRIQGYQEFERQMLGIAATVGLTFQFEVLLLGSRSQSVPVMRALQRAMDEGLIVRVTDEPDLRHLGKTFMFAHKKARDAIYEGIDLPTRRQLHKAIGEKLAVAVPEAAPTMLFALAHHFNAALIDGKTDDRALAERALKFNRKAGEAAYRSGSWQTAERYFENAVRIMEHWHNELVDKVEQAQVHVVLADLAAIQKRHGKALRVYREILTQGMPRTLHAQIAYKAVYFQMVGGIVSDTVRLLEHTLRLLQKAVPKVNLLGYLKLGWSLAGDLLPLSKTKKHLHRILATAHRLRKEDSEVLDDKTPAIKFYLAGTSLLTQIRRDHALMYHQSAMQEASSGQGSPASLIKVVGERAALLGYLGFYKTSYRFLELAMDVARACRLRNVYGYVALLRVLTIDYVKGRHDDVSEHLRVALAYLHPNEDRLAYGIGLLFKIFRDLSRGHFTGVYRYSQRMPDTIPTRNWLSPRSVSMMLFGYLLQGSRVNIVRHGEMFLRRRQQVASRSDDLFVKIIYTLIAFAKGETDKTRTNFKALVYGFADQGKTRFGQKRAFLLPFEEDFIALFAFILPVIFEQEYGRHLMRVKEMRPLLLQLKTRLRQLKGRDRSVPLLLTARVKELLGEPANVRQQYDQAIKSAKLGNENLVRVLGNFWFGLHMLANGQAQKRDYLRRAYKLAGKLEMKALTDTVRKAAEKCGLSQKDLEAESKTGDQSRKATDNRPQLFIDHLTHLCEAAEATTSLADDLDTSFQILAKHYQAAQFYCVLTHSHGEPRLVYPQAAPAMSQQVLDYIEPYFNIRSTLFLPLADAPWSKVTPTSGMMTTKDLQPVGVLPVATPNSPANDSTSFDGNSTLLMSETATSNSHERLLLSSGAAHSVANESTSLFQRQTAGTGTPTKDSRTWRHGQVVVPSGQSMQMSALVPIRAGSSNVGVIFIDDINNRFDRDTAHCRQELDQFGLQVGLLVERKAAMVALGKYSEPGRAGQATYQSASTTLEPSAWLRLWQHGLLRVQRETSWYLGLNFGTDQYVLAYCLIHGPEPLRERLASMLWHHLYVIRAQAVAAGRNHIEVAHLHEELAGLIKAYARLSSLDNFSLAFSIFNRDDQVAFSGHFGSARPFVIGVDNVITPDNDVIAHFSSGRDLRYWEVAASLSEPHTYILSYDTAKLDAVPADTVQKQVAVNLVKAAHIKELHSFLSHMVNEDNLPRYYVAAMLDLAPKEVEQSGSISMNLAKAE